MESRKLKLEDLVVDSFHTAPSLRARGTVRGHDYSEICASHEFNTCPATCGATCLSCGPTACHTCVESCYGTCEWQNSCLNTCEYPMCTSPGAAC